MKKLRYLLLMLLACPVMAGDRDVEVVVVVVDASGSMRSDMRGTNEVKMDIAKTALKSVLGEVNSDTLIGILVFGKVRNEWVYPIGTKDQHRLIASIDSIQASGNTPLGAFIKKGADALLQVRAKRLGYGSYRLLVVTDGEASDQRKVDSYVPDVKSRGIRLDVIGVDMAKTHGLASVASSYREGNNPKALVAAMKDVFAEVSANDGDMTEGFELIAPIQEDLAQAMIGALVINGNHPIGDSPPAKTQDPMDNTRSSTDPSLDSDGISGTGLAFAAIAVVVVFGIVIARG